MFSEDTRFCKDLPPSVVLLTVNHKLFLYISPMTLFVGLEDVIALFCAYQPFTKLASITKNGFLQRTDPLHLFFISVCSFLSDCLYN